MTKIRAGLTEEIAMRDAKINSVYYELGLEHHSANNCESAVEQSLLVTRKLCYPSRVLRQATNYLVMCGDTNDSEGDNNHE